MGGDGWKDGWTDGRTDVWKFTPVSYRTSALWGRCPKSIWAGAGMQKMPENAENAKKLTATDGWADQQT